MKRTNSWLTFVAWLIIVSPTRADVSRTFTYEGGQFQLGDGTMSVSLEAEGAPSSVHVSKDGNLTIDGSEVATDKSDRKRLKEFVGEAEKMAAILDEVAAYVARQRDPNTNPAEMEGIAKRIQKTGRSLEKQNLKVAQVAQKLLEQIPELEFLRSMVSE